MLVILIKKMLSNHVRKKTNRRYYGGKTIEHKSQTNNIFWKKVKYLLVRALLKPNKIQNKLA